jgi:bacterioferritin-associated ferredoxin
MRDPKPVKMCVCTGIQFSEVVASGLRTIDEIRETLGCSSHCGLCEPYLKRCLETKETEFPVLPPQV